MAAIDESEVAVANILIEKGKYQEAYDLAKKAAESDPKDVRTYLAKGIASFHLDKYQEAKDSFTEGQKLDSTNDQLKLWVRKCDAELNLSKKQSAGAKTGSSTAEPAPMPSRPKMRYDWYQTETHVIITILLKNVKKEECTVDIQEKYLSAIVKLPSSRDYSLELDLAYPIDPENSSTKVLTSKIEVKLKKIDGIRWSKLEGDGEDDAKKNTPGMPGATKPAATANNPTKYPSASKKDWDKIAAGVDEDKSEGDAALNELFQKIYADGSDEVKKAMMKSFYESGGTVLSTNWNEVGQDKVDVKPPDGMEYKKWDS